MRPSFIETIRLEDGVPQLLEWHEQRMRRTLKAYYPTTEVPKLGDWLPSDFPLGRCKWRVVYSDVIEEVSVEPYQPRLIRSLRVVEVSDLDYSYKRLDRQSLNACYSQRGGCDDVLIVRGGYLTDTTIANLALSDGHRWYTPRHPLLAGTARAELLNRGILELRDIRLEELHLYRRIRLINAMLPWGEVELDIKHIVQDNIQT